MKKEKEMAELRKCTFSPDLMRTNRMEFDEDFNTRMSHWQKEKERKLEEIGVFQEFQRGRDSHNNYIEKETRERIIRMYIYTKS